VKLRLDLDPEVATALTGRAAGDLRPVDMEAEALLRQALGLPVPIPPPQADSTSEQPKGDAA
jgi:hypothetical protein